MILLLFYFNHNYSLYLVASYSANFNLSENCLASDANNFLYLKIISNSSRSLSIDLYSKPKDFTFNVNDFRKINTCLH